MARGKIDRLNEFYAEMVRDAIDSVRLELLEGGTAIGQKVAECLDQRKDVIAARSQAYYTYERLEVADIIKGHKRAWPEVVA